jgi:trehalose 6-phosphate phosphatase
VTDNPSEAIAAKFAKLDVTAVALLLDVDGTLLDIAPTPDTVHVSAELRSSLARLLDATGGALALVSGRPIADLDRLFAPLRPPAIGGHGAEMRLRGTEAISCAEALPADLRRKLAAAATAGSGILIEDKGYSLALHYRNAPQREAALRADIAAAIAAFPAEAVEILAGKAVFEVKRPGVNKGEAVRRLMAHAPFAGRRPVFVGDDVTDESVFALLPALGGIGFSVSRHVDGLAGMFASPANVRSALQILADRAPPPRT